MIQIREQTVILLIIWNEFICNSINSDSKHIPIVMIFFSTWAYQMEDLDSENI